MNKHAVKSTTFWFNVANIAAAVLLYIYKPEIFTPEVAATWLSGKGLANLALRFKTKTGITLK